MLKHLRIVKDLVLLIFTLTSKVNKWGHSFWDFPVSDPTLDHQSQYDSYQNRERSAAMWITCPSGKADLGMSGAGCNSKI